MTDTRTPRLITARSVVTARRVPGTDPVDVLDLLGGPLFHRRLLSQTNPTADYAQRIADVILKRLWRLNPAERRRVGAAVPALTTRP
jgi:hypothetical protein